MRAITKVHLLSLAVLLIIAAGANQYWAWTKIQREEQTVPVRAQMEEGVRSQNLPYAVKDADIKEYVNALGAKYVEGHFYTLIAKDPKKFLHALSHQNGEKIIYKAFAGKKIPLRHSLVQGESKYGAEGKDSSDIILPHPRHVYWAGGFDGEGLVIYYESYPPPPSSLPHGSTGFFKALSEQGVTFRYEAARPFHIAWAITGPLLAIAYITAWGSTICPWSRPRQAEPQVEGDKTTV